MAEQRPIGWNGPEAVARYRVPLADRSALGSSTSLAGKMMTGQQGTQLSKDWEQSRDLEGRGQRLAIHRERRKTSKDGAHYMGASQEGPFVRGPRFEPLDGGQDIWSWHEERVKEIFSQLDIKQSGNVFLDQLEDSFSMMQVPIDEDMFAKYIGEFLPSGIESVNFQQFMDFHKAVWSNQPAAVRYWAGCTSAFSGIAAIAESTESSARRFQRSSSAPSGVSVKDVRDLERQLRKAYRNHSSAKYEPLRFEQLPDLLKDLGLEASGMPDVESEARKQFNVAEADSDSKVSFHEFVEFQNRYVASLEAARAARFAKNFKAPASTGAAAR